MNTDLQDTNVNEESVSDADSVTENQRNGESAAVDEEHADGNMGADTGDGNTGNSAESSDNSDNESEVPFLTARYNKKDVPLTQEKALEYAQKGMHYEDKLSYLAAIKGTTISEMLSKEIKDLDDAERERLKEQFGDDADMIDKCMKIFHDEQREKYDKAVADRKTAEEEKEKNRNLEIADEFLSLQKSFPNLKTISDIPKSVIKEAANINLEHAYLKYLHSEGVKRQEALAKQEETAKQSAGSVTSNANSSDTSIDEFLKGLWDK